jgi:hypothetical protein
MAMRGLALPVVLACLAQASGAKAQTSMEVTQSVGGSTEEVAAAGTQLRLFGEVLSGTRFTLEGAWGTRSPDEGDAFGVAYPYDNRVRAISSCTGHGCGR